ncbi:MAG: DUF4129 domain-containing protein [Pyrinomonadaceae bacterium]|nr:DUF4129 domain-containing protein [Pyrinomonadaceae bacterium]
MTRSLRSKFGNSLKRVLAALLFCLVSASPAAARTLDEYRNAVLYARELTLQLLYPEAETTRSAAAYAAFEKQKLQELRSALPRSEKIEFQGNSIETDNGWYFEKLDEYENGAKESEKRELVLTAISERLDSIAKKTAELQNPGAAKTSKDEDKRKLSEILRREEYRKAEEGDKSMIRQMYDAVIKWLDELFPKIERKPGESFGFGQIASILVYVVLGLLLVGIGYLIYKFAPALIRRYRTREKTDNGDRVILGETLSADQRSSDIIADAERLARDGDLRGAIRKGYIALLFELGERKIIGISRHKTNRDYLRDVRERKLLHEKMNGLTKTYERHWYGFGEPQSGDWEEFKTVYKEALNG